MHARFQEEPSVVHPVLLRPHTGGSGDPWEQEGACPALLGVLQASTASHSCVTSHRGVRLCPPSLLPSPGKEWM